jgi:hypothetical protein
MLTLQEQTSVRQIISNMGINNANLLDYYVEIFRTYHPEYTGAEQLLGQLAGIQIHINRGFDHRGQPVGTLIEELDKFAGVCIKNFESRCDTDAEDDSSYEDYEDYDYDSETEDVFYL